jgi:hypothetical protein
MVKVFTQDYYVGRAGLVDALKVVVLGRHPPLDPDAVVLTARELAAEALRLARGHPQHEVGGLPQLRTAGVHAINEEHCDLGNGHPVSQAAFAPVIPLILEWAALPRWNEHLVAQPPPIELLAVPARGIEPGTVVVSQVSVEVVAFDDR